MTLPHRQSIKDAENERNLEANNAARPPEKHVETIALRHQAELKGFARVFMPAFIVSKRWRDDKM